MIVLVAFGQFFLKKGAIINEESNEKKTFLKQLFSKYVLIGISFIISAPLLYIGALKYLPLNRAYVLTSINIVIVSLIGKYAFKEKLSANRTIGIVLILIGVIIYSINISN